MLKQFNRFLFIALVVAAALYITLTNSDTATLKLGPKLTISTYAGVIYIGVFAAGCIAASIVALFFGFKGFLRERRLRSLERARQSFFKSQEQARTLMACGDWGAARALWESVIGEDPENIVARVELSKCIEELGDPREALRILDSTRASSRSNAEVLIRAAKLNHTLDNKTAARDNFALVIADYPCRQALEMARQISEELGDFTQALKYHEELERMGYASENSVETRARLSFKQTVANEQNEDARREALLALAKRNPTFTASLEKLAEDELNHGRADAAAEYLVKAARASKGDVSKWRAVVDLWLNNQSIDQKQRGDRAIAAARSATKDTIGVSRIEAEFLLIETLLSANRFQDAEGIITGVTALASKEGVALSEEQTQRLNIQEGYCVSLMGSARDTAPIWEKLATGKGRSATSQSTKISSASGTSEPSPSLSTP